MDPDWTLWRSFLAVCEEGSLSGAARTLGLTQPTVGRHVNALEAALGTALFTRAQSGLVPTATATELLPEARAMAAMAASLLRVASSEVKEARGTIRLTASEIVGVEFLPPMLAAFRAANPAIEIELMLSNQMEDLLHRKADIAIRMVRPTQAALVARKVGHVTVGLHAHERYLRANGTPRKFTELARHAVIGFDTETPAIRSMRRRTLAFDRNLFAFRSDSDLAQLAAIRSGLGIGGCQLGIARREPELKRVLAADFALDLDVWVVMHEDLRAVRRMRLMFDHLVEGLAGIVE